MPNWVHNRITVTGPKEVLDGIEKKLHSEESVFDFGRLLPRPDDKEDDWYNWNVTNWGTKWDACDPHRSRDADDTLTYTFRTAWSPPGGIIDAFITQHTDVDFVFDYEEEQGWGGQVTVSKGAITDQSSYDAPNTHAGHIERYGECGCTPDHPYFDDCLGALAEELRGVTGETLEAAKALSPGWEGDLDELISAAETL